MDFNMNVLTNMILTRYFTEINYCLFVITDDLNEINIVTNNDVNNIPIVNLKLLNEDYEYDVFSKNFGCNYFVIKTKETCKTFKMIEYMIERTYSRFNERKYLILPGTNHLIEQLNDQIDCILQSDEINYVDDVLLIVSETINYDDSIKLEKFSNETIIFDLITHKYVGDIHNDRVLLDKWYAKNRTFLHNNNLYPDKLKNQEGRQLRLTTFTYPPYAIPESNNGLDLRLAMLYAKLHNMTTILIVDEEYTWGEIIDYGIGNGVIGNVVTDRVDIGFAALYAFAREYAFLDYSRPYSRSCIICVVPMPRLSDGWLTPIEAFSYQLWIAVLITFLFVILSFFLIATIIEWNLRINLRRKIISTLMTDAIFNTISIFFMQSVQKSKMINCKLFKFIFGLSLLISVILSSSYSSGLASNMTIPKYVGEIKTVEDLERSKLRWGGPTILWIVNVLNDTEPSRSLLYKKYEVLTVEELHQQTKTNNFAFVTERLPAGHYALPEYIQGPEIYSLTTMKEDLYADKCVFVLRKSSILLPSFNEFLAKICQTGILYHLETKIVMESMNSTLQRVLMNNNRNEFHHKVAKIKINNLAGAFGILCIGLLLSSILFLLEYYGHKF